MSNLKKRSRVITAFAATMLISLAIAGGVSADATVDKAPGALTAPPPVEMNIMSMNPQNVYLSDATTSIRNSGSSSLQVSANTYASQLVDSIGANMYLQRWTGTLWVDIESSFERTTNSSSYFGVKNWGAINGYYYRGKTVHWVKKGSTYEEAVTHSDTILMSK